jgi:hypothetical protein
MVPVRRLGVHHEIVRVKRQLGLTMIVLASGGSIKEYRASASYTVSVCLRLLHSRNSCTTLATTVPGTRHAHH